LTVQLSRNYVVQSLWIGSGDVFPQPRREGMERKSKIAVIMRSISESLSCHLCETRLRFGDLECPHCGEDIEPVFYEWAEKLMEEMDH